MQSSRVGPHNLQIIQKGLQTKLQVDEIKKGLNCNHKTISPKFFYDEKGSLLFNQICGTKAYYQTRTEQRILESSSKKISRILGQAVNIIEPGAGNMQKIRTILDVYQPVGYLGIDVSKKEVTNAGYNLAIDFPKLNVIGVVGDFYQIEHEDLEQWLPNGVPRAAFFPGSTIGNFEPDNAVSFLKRLGKSIGKNQFAILGVDLKKRAEILHLAYNDPEGYTKEFNLNVLQRLNRDYNSDFDLKKFKHRAFYNQELGRVEMHLVSIADQVVSIGEDIFKFKEGETIHTENSYKYSRKSFLTLVQSAGFNIEEFFTDTEKYFAVAVIKFSPQKTAS